MPDYTPNLNLYLPGGGGSGTIPDEIADIDKLNENFRLIDASLGGTIVPAVAGYTPDFDGNVVYARNERRLLMESAVDGGLLNISPGANYFRGTAAEREAFKAYAEQNDIWVDSDGKHLTYYKYGAAWLPKVSVWNAAAGQVIGGASPNWNVLNTAEKWDAQGDVGTWDNGFKATAPGRYRVEFVLQIGVAIPLYIGVKLNNTAASAVNVVTQITTTGHAGWVGGIASRAIDLNAGDILTPAVFCGGTAGPYGVTVYGTAFSVERL